jgi:hypothetical protein
MTAQPYLGIVEDAHVVNARATLDAMGLGPAGFSVPLVDKDDNTATFESPALAWCQMDASADNILVGQLQALCGGDAPGLDANGNTILWGVDGVISQVDALEAFGGNHVMIVAIVGKPENERLTWINGELALHGYKKRPSEL